ETTTVGKLPDFELNTTPDYSILPEEVAPKTVPRGDPFQNGNGAGTSPTMGGSGTVVTTPVRNAPSVISVPAPPTQNPDSTGTTEWTAGDANWEEGAGPDATKRRILIPNRPPAQNTQNVQSVPTTTTNPEPELTLPAGASRLW
ncbi:MAG: hypothetical protein Q4C47_03250, partial [Planctomycetia bacterium]|nr:hypothetical protein [Planctomycetia bacterium]